MSSGFSQKRNQRLLVDLRTSVQLPLSDVCGAMVSTSYDTINQMHEGTKELRVVAILSQMGYRIRGKVNVNFGQAEL